MSSRKLAKMNNMMDKELISLVKKFTFIKQKSPNNPKFVKKLEKAMEQDYKELGKQMPYDILNSIQDALPYEKQDKELFHKKGLVLLKNNRMFCIDSIEYKDESMSDMYFNKNKNQSRFNNNNVAKAINVINLTGDNSSLQGPWPMINLTNDDPDRYMITKILIMFGKMGINVSGAMVNAFVWVLKNHGLLMFKTFICVFISYNLHVSPTPNNRSFPVKTLNSVLAGPSRAFTGVNNNSGLVHQTVAGMVPWGGAYKMGELVAGGMHPLMIPTCAGAYYVTGFVMGGGRILKRSHNINVKTGKNMGLVIMNELKKQFPTEIQETFNVLYNSTLGQIGELKYQVKLLGKQVEYLSKQLLAMGKRWFKQVAGLFNDIMNTFIGRLPDVIKKTLGMPFDEFKRMLCGASNSMKWLSNTKFSKALRQRLGCSDVCNNGYCLESNYNKQLSNSNIKLIGDAMRGELIQIKRGAIAQRIFGFGNKNERSIKRKGRSELYKLQKQFNNIEKEHEEIKLNDHFPKQKFKQQRVGQNKYKVNKQKANKWVVKGQGKIRGKGQIGFKPMAKGGRAGRGR